MLGKNRIQQLITLGLNKYEACAYLALLGHDESSAVEVSNRGGVPLQRVYDVLASLRDRGWIVTKDGRPVRHTAREPAVALDMLLETRRRQQQTENERLAALAKVIVSELGLASNGEPEPDVPHPRPARTQQLKPLGGF